ncbi:MAG: sigma-70 family RNA polymerase sigma factor [Ekhidna sp.]
MGDHAITLLKGPNSGETRMTPGLDELFAAHHRKVFRAAYRVTGSIQDAEDILQSVFLRLVQRPGGANPAGYLCRSAINAGIDLLRSRARAPGEELIAEMHASDDNPDGEARQTEIRRHLQVSLGELQADTILILAPE